MDRPTEITTAAKAAGADKTPETLVAFALGYSAATTPTEPVAAHTHAFPGRLGNPGMNMLNDPRVDPRQLSALGPVNMAGTAAVSPCPKDTAPYSAGGAKDGSGMGCLEFCGLAEAGFGAGFTHMLKGAAPITGVIERTETIKGVDGNEITLRITSPSGAGPFACIYYTHGGGMAVSSIDDPNYAYTRRALAARGAVAVFVEFRNSAGRLGSHPFPAGLNDCCSGLEWVMANKAGLNVHVVVIAGESGGGNLCLATTLKQKLEGKVQPDGVYALCPFVSNLYSESEMTTEGAKPLLSLYENDGQLLSASLCATMTKCYSPDGKDDRNPLAWPLYATEEQLKGFPPTVISVNECDLLRDEGLEMARKLRRARVPGHSRCVIGTCHAGDMFLYATMPDVCFATIDDMLSFANTLKSNLHASSVWEAPPAGTE